MTELRLNSWLVSQGGVRDPGGDVRHTLGRYKDRPGLVSSRGFTPSQADRGGNAPRLGRRRRSESGPLRGGAQPRRRFAGRDSRERPAPMTTDWIDTVEPALAEAGGKRRQIVLPGAERSARQAQAARDQQGRGMMRHRVAQREPGPLFAPVSHEPELPL